MLSIVRESKLNINSFNFASLVHFDLVILNHILCEGEWAYPHIWSHNAMQYILDDMTGWLDFCISYDYSIVRKNITITSSLKSYCYNNVNSLLVNSKLSFSGCWKEYLLSSFLKLSVNISASFIFLIAEATTSASRLTLKRLTRSFMKTAVLQTSVSVITSFGFIFFSQSLQIISCCWTYNKTTKKNYDSCNIILLKLWIHSGFQQVIQGTSSHIKRAIQCKTCS